MGITAVQRSACLQMMQKFAYASSEAKYNQLHEVSNVMHQKRLKTTLTRTGTLLKKNAYICRIYLTSPWMDNPTS